MYVYFCGALSLSCSLSLSLSLSLVWCGGVVSLLLLLMTLMSARYPQNCGVTAPL